MDATLDTIGRRYGTGKSSAQRDLLRRYERIVAPFRYERFDLLEIGVGDGASLWTWLEYFPNARVVGLDARRVFLPDMPDRCTVVQGAQNDVAVLIDLIRRFRFRLAIDDGSRRGDDQLASFLALFPALEPNGLYACEGVWHETPKRESTTGEVRDGDGGTSEPANSRGLLDLALALGRFAAEGIEPDPLPVDQPRFAAIARRAESVLLLPRMLVVTTKDRRP